MKYRCKNLVKEMNQQTVINLNCMVMLVSLIETDERVQPTLPNASQPQCHFLTRINWGKRDNYEKNLLEV